jgi:glycerophosphoryl diester phosphodiesterase
MVDPVAVKVFGHRGGRTRYPENTIAAFAGAMQAGVHGIELDVQRCASKELVVIHDADLRRTTNGAGLVGDTTLSDLKKLDAGSWFGAEFSAERIPTLLEVLELVDGNVVINIELKNSPVDYPGIEDDLAELISHYKYPDRLIISSFDHRLLKRVSDKTDYEVAVLAGCLFNDIGGYAAEMNANWWHPDFDVLLVDAVEEAHAAQISVNTWTVNGTANWQKALAMGVDGIITDDPDGLIALLDQRALSNEAVC